MAVGGEEEEVIMFCTSCGRELDSSVSFCPFCGHKVADGHSEGNTTDASGSASDAVREWIGLKRLQGFSFKDLFREAFHAHTRRELDDYFLVGGEATTPGLDALRSGWPHPWVFVRQLTLSLSMWGVSYLCYKCFDGGVAVPSVLLFGTVALPLAVLTFFFEMNAWRNVPYYRIVRFVVSGGVLGLFYSLLLFDFLGAECHPAVAALVEEPSKLFVLLLMSRGWKDISILNGILFGAAVGTGFEVLESLGYSCAPLLGGCSDVAETVSQMMDSVMIRGLTAPFSHIIWTAVAGGALFRAIGKGNSVGGALASAGFLRVFALSIALHMTWNCLTLLPDEMCLLTLIGWAAVGCAGWWIVMHLIGEGLLEMESRISR